MIISTRLVVALLLGASVVPAACGERTDERTAVGVVTSVDGDLHQVDGFTLRLSDGRDLSFVAGANATFHGGPLAHIREHLATGIPVEVTYTEQPDGSLLAVSVGDA